MNRIYIDVEVPQFPCLHQPGASVAHAVLVTPSGGRCCVPCLASCAVACSGEFVAAGEDQDRTCCAMEHFLLLCSYDAHVLTLVPSLSHFFKNALVSLHLMRRQADYFMLIRRLACAVATVDEAAFTTGFVSTVNPDTASLSTEMLVDTLLVLSDCIDEAQLERFTAPTFDSFCVVRMLLDGPLAGCVGGLAMNSMQDAMAADVTFCDASDGIRLTELLLFLAMQCVHWEHAAERCAQLSNSGACTTCVADGNDSDTLSFRLPRILDECCRDRPLEFLTLVAAVAKRFHTKACDVTPNALSLLRLLCQSKCWSQPCTSWACWEGGDQCIATLLPLVLSSSPDIVATTSLVLGDLVNLRNHCVFERTDAPPTHRGLLVSIVEHCTESLRTASPLSSAPLCALLDDVLRNGCVAFSDIPIALFEHLLALCERQDESFSSRILPSDVFQRLLLTSEVHGTMRRLSGALRSLNHTDALRLLAIASKHPDRGDLSVDAAALLSNQLVGAVSSLGGEGGSQPALLWSAVYDAADALLWLVDFSSALDDCCVRICRLLLSSSLHASDGVRRLLVLGRTVVRRRYLPSPSMQRPPDPLLLLCPLLNAAIAASLLSPEYFELASEVCAALSDDSFRLPQVLLCTRPDAAPRDICQLLHWLCEKGLVESSAWLLFRVIRALDCAGELQTEGGGVCSVDLCARIIASCFTFQCELGAHALCSTARREAFLVCVSCYLAVGSLPSRLFADVTWVSFPHTLDVVHGDLQWMWSTDVIGHLVTARQSAENGNRVALSGFLAELRTCGDGALFHEFAASIAVVVIRSSAPPTVLSLVASIAEEALPLVCKYFFTPTLPFGELTASLPWSTPSPRTAGDVMIDYLCHCVEWYPRTTSRVLLSTSFVGPFLVCERQVDSFSHYEQRAERLARLISECMVNEERGGTCAYDLLVGQWALRWLPDPAKRASSSLRRLLIIIVHRAHGNEVAALITQHLAMRPQAPTSSSDACHLILTVQRVAADEHPWHVSAGMLLSFAIRDGRITRTHGAYALGIAVSFFDHLFSSPSDPAEATIRKMWLVLAAEVSHLSDCPATLRLAAVFSSRLVLLVPNLANEVSTLSLWNRIALRSRESQSESFEGTSHARCLLAEASRSIRCALKRLPDKPSWSHIAEKLPLGITFLADTENDEDLHNINSNSQEWLPVDNTNTFFILWPPP